MMGEARRHVRHVPMMGQESRHKAAQRTQFGRVVLTQLRHCIRTHNISELCPDSGNQAEF